MVSIARFAFVALEEPQNLFPQDVQSGQAGAKDLRMFSQVKLVLRTAASASEPQTSSI